MEARRWGFHRALRIDPPGAVWHITPMSFRPCRLATLLGPLLLCAALAIPAFPVHAEMFKCKRADGKTSFQDSPCEKGAESSPVIVNDPSPAYDPTAKSRAPTLKPKADKAPQSLTPLADENLRQRNRQLEVENRRIYCAAARRDVEVLKKERPVYSHDKQGNKVYVEDSDRAAELAAAQQRAAEMCK